LQYNIGITGGCCGTTPEYIKSMNYVKERPHSITVKKDNSKYIMSQYSYIDIDKPFSTYEWVINKEDIIDCIDNAYDISEKNTDSFVITYKANNIEFVSELINQVQDILRKPLIFAFDDELSINAALRSYCGIAGVYNYEHKYSVKM
jgi:5-methyltetrahydrofolate--homocysteine methyltransferase